MELLREAMFAISAFVCILGLVCRDKDLEKGDAHAKRKRYLSHQSLIQHPLGAAQERHWSELGCPHCFCGNDSASVLASKWEALGS